MKYENVVFIDETIQKGEMIQNQIKLSTRKNNKHARFALFLHKQFQFLVWVALSGGDALLGTIVVCFPLCSILRQCSDQLYSYVFSIISFRKRSP